MDQAYLWFHMSFTWFKDAIWDTYHVDTLDSMVEMWSQGGWIVRKWKYKNIFS